MDISIVKDYSIKIKDGRGGTTLITDPITKTEGDIVLITDRSEEYDIDKVEGKRLVITGPGEYEIGGVSIMGKDNHGDQIFQINNSSRICLLPSSAISKMQEEDEFDAVLIKVNKKITDDSFSVFNAKLVILYGDANLMQLKDEKVERVNRLSLKKSEFTGKIIILSQ